MSSERDVTKIFFKLNVYIKPVSNSALLNNTLSLTLIILNQYLVVRY